MENGQIAMRSKLHWARLVMSGPLTASAALSDEYGASAFASNGVSGQ